MLTTGENHADTSFCVWMMKHIGRNADIFNSKVKITALQLDIVAPLFCNVKAT